MTTSSVLTGARAARVDSNAFYHRQVPVEPGRRYGVAAYAIATAAGQTARLAYEWRRADHSAITGGTVDLAASTSGYLPLHLQPALAPDGSAYLHLALKSTAAGAYVHFDDIAPTYSTIRDFDGTGAPTSVLDANGHVTRSGYDAASRLTSMTDARGKTTSLTLDKNGNVTRSSDPLGHVSESVYDALGRQTRRTVDPSGLALVTRASYDEVGNLASTTDADGRTTRFEYDRADRLTTVTDALDGITRYGCDANGNRTSVTNPRGKTRRGSYDDVGRLTEVRDALGRVTSYGYDPNGNRTRRTDAKGVETTFGYDDANRLTTVTYPGPASIAYEYDDAGRLTRMTDDHGTTTWTYDDLDRVRRVTQPTVGEVGYGYDRVGNRTSLALPGKSVSYAYDELDRLTRVTDWADRQATYAYDDAGRLSSLQLPNGVSGSYAHDAADRLTRIAYSRSGTSLASFDYTLNGSGQKLTEAGPAGTTHYAYDALHRLSEVTYPDGGVESFTYDPSGNRSTRTRGGLTTNYSYADADQLLSETTGPLVTTYEYDANGNRTRRIGTDPLAPLSLYGYDIENRLVSVQQGTTLAEYRYDGAGNRYTKTVGATTTTYTLDLASALTEVLAESDGTTYLYGADLLAMERAGGSNWYLPDALGSTRRVTDDTGNVVASYEYEAFGAVRQSTGTLANDVRFTGERADPESGLVFLRARHYDPAAGRFLQADRWPYDERISQDLRYTYVRNDPANAVDPTGHWPWDGWDRLVPRPVRDVAAGVGSFVYDNTIGAGQQIVGSGQRFFEKPSLETGLEFAGQIAINSFWGKGIGVLGRGLGLLGRSGRAAVRGGRGLGAAFGAPRPRLAPPPRAGALGGGSLASRSVRRVDTPQVRTPQGTRACSLHSFRPDTPVATPRGHVPIGALAVGDRVKGYDESRGTTGSYRVTKVHVHRDEETGTVVVDGESIETTPKHPFFTLESGWVDAADLWPGAHLLEADGELGTVESVEFSVAPAVMYNLTVERAHTFFVGSGEWLVHNCYAGGRFGNLGAPPGIQRHHMPADSVSPLSTANGPAIQMEMADHMATASWGRSTMAQQYRARQKLLIDQGRFDDAIEMDIDDVRSKFGSKYDEAILQMIDSLP